MSELSLFIKKQGYFSSISSGDGSSFSPPSKLDAPLALETFGRNTCTSIFLVPTHHCLHGLESKMQGIHRCVLLAPPLGVQRMSFNFVVVLSAVNNKNILVRVM